MSINLQDLLAILGPILTLMGFMWHHSNSRFEKIDEKIDSLKVEINSVEKRLEEKIIGVEKRLSEDISSVEQRLNERLGEKIDAVRDRVSRIEGQLTPAKVISFEETRTKPAARPTHSKATQAH